MTTSRRHVTVSLTADTADEMKELVARVKYVAKPGVTNSDVVAVALRLIRDMNDDEVRRLFPRDVR
jgi:Arc/MetJ-type ribon-helix-helix transcriptional regulator